MELNPTPEHQELMLKLEDTVWASDRAFFEASPKRRFRLRPSFDLEIRDCEMTFGEREMEPGPGTCWWTLVIALAPGVRMRFRFTWYHNAMPDPPEAVCKAMFKTLASLSPDLRDKVDKMRWALKDLDKKSG